MGKGLKDFRKKMHESKEKFDKYESEKNEEYKRSLENKKKRIKYTDTDYKKG